MPPGSGFTGSSDLLIRLNADPKGFVKGLRTAQREMRTMERELARKERELAKLDSAMETAGQGMLAFGAAAAAGLALAAREAIQWETAWTGVLKTVNGSDSQMAALEQSLRDMTGVLPATHEEIAGVAEAAGQLGIKRRDIAAFTRTMIDLGQTTNLSATDAAMALARFMNIMGTSASKVSNLGATIVDLGNKSATTEAEILEMAMRIAGAGATIGLSEADVLAFAAALSSAGIEAEAGGSAISRVFVDMQVAVNEGGEKLETFARVAGMSSSDFQKAFRTDAAGAINSFVQGLGRMQTAGGDVFGTLEDLNLSEIRVRDAMLRLSGAGDLLTKSLHTGNTAWDENKALAEEAEKRYGTTAAQMGIAQNRVRDFAITIGEVLLPVLGDMAAFLGGAADAFNSWSPGVQALLVILVSLAAVIGIVGGAALIAVPKVHAFNAALAQMSGPVAGAARKGLSALGSFLTGPLGAALGVAVIAAGVFMASQAASAAQVKELTATLDQQTGAITDNTRTWVAHKLEEDGYLQTAKTLGIDLATLTDAILGEERALAEVNSIISAAKDKTGDLSEEDQLLADTADRLSEKMGEMNGKVLEGKDAFEREKEAIGATESEVVELTGAEQALAESLGITSEQAKSGADAISDLDQEIQALLDHAFGLVKAEDALQEQIIKTTEAALENGGALKGNTDAARENRRNMEDLAGAVADLAFEEYKATGNADAATSVIDDQIEFLRENAEQLGLTAAEVEDYIEVLEDLKGTYRVDVVTRYTSSGQAPFRHGQGPVAVYQTGGLVSGRSGVDKVPAMLTNNEFVVRESATRRHLPLLQAINAGATPTLGGSGGRTFHVENLNMQAWSDHFDAKQVQDNLEWHLAFSGAE